jgi:hypothetical protein
MDYAPLRAGTLTAHSVDKRSRLVLETTDGKPVASIGPGPDPSAAALEAADGKWGVRGVDVSAWRGAASWSVTDPAGKEVATLAKGRSERTLGLPAGDATWEYHALRSPHYQVAGMFSANRKALHRFAPGFTRRPFGIEVTEALVARPDHSLLLLLAAWCTDVHIASKVDAAGA